MTGDRVLSPGDIVQITDDRGRHHTLVLQPGATFHTHRGSISHDDLLGQPEGIVVTTTGGTRYVALRSLLEVAGYRDPEGAWKLIQSLPAAEKPDSSAASSM